MSIAQPSNSPRVLRIGEVAEYIGVSRKTLSRWIAAGTVRKIPGSSFISAREIERFLGESGSPRRPSKGSAGRIRQ
jgi:hypothetical protein